MITTVLFLISAVLAIPTFGISLILFFVAKSWWDRQTADAIAKHVYLSFKNGGTSYDLARVNGAGIRKFYNKYGTETPRYTFDASGKGNYFGTVNFAGVGDLAAFVFRMDGRITIHAAKEPKATFESLMDGSFVNNLVDSHMQAFNQNDSQSAVKKRQQQLLELLSDADVRYEIRIFVKHGFVGGVYGDAIEHVERCIDIAKQMSTLTGQPVSEILALAAGIPIETTPKQ